MTIHSNKLLKDSKGLTILICTYNGSSRLPQTLAHLSAQIVSTTIKWEIIVIDNASTDNSLSIARSEWEKYNLPGVHFNAITESKPGKINALKAGSALAQFEYLIICDDDNWLAPDYVQKTYHLLEEDPSIGAVGGQSIMVNDSGTYPSWFENYSEGYAIGKQGSIIGDVTSSRGYLWGAGLGTRTNLYKDLFKHFPSLLVGREGEKLSAGEDSEYCQRLILRGYKLIYDPTLVFNHYIPSNRLEVSYREALYAGFAECSIILEKYYFLTKLKLHLDAKGTNKLFVLLRSFFRAIFISSKEKRNHEKKIITYLLHFKFKNDPILQKIVNFERRDKL